MTVTDTFDTVDDVCDYLVLPDTLREPLRRLQAAASRLGTTSHADLVRIDLCHRIRLAQDSIFAAVADPVPAYARLIELATRSIEASLELPLADIELMSHEGDTPQDVTATHYGHLWGGFSPEHYFGEATELLRARFERNGFDLSKAPRERVLDAGCGGGRYSVALKKLGFAEVVGVDWSTQGIAVANARIQEANIAGVSYQTADVLKLPFSNGEFDVVFSNGVLHHTYDTQRGVDELHRVMKPGGRGWLYLYHRPGGLDRLTHYLARLLLKHARHEVCRRYCHALGMPANRIFFFLDLWLTPIAEAYTPAEMDTMLGAAGFQKWRRAARGADQDLVEQIHAGEPFATAKYGVGENRYLIDA
jgi:ubiquinone/menaquinone biosynthesis C-methylase UbiE